jgi:4-diphosphocytidyl-2-C-methyl-D-erythritol kinase
VSGGIELAAPAKVNLRLCILSREASGFHALETVFCALELADRVRLEPGGAGIRLTVSGEVDTGAPERNLALRAAQVYYREAGLTPALELRLEKEIPAAAGLGGGSSDAAAVLRGLDALHGGAVPRERLLQLAIGLGADVPFFLCGSPLALAWGRGERLAPLPALPARPVLVAHPGTAMPTFDAFRALAALRGDVAAPVAALLDPRALASWEGVAGLARNDFEAVVVPRIPGLRTALDSLRASGAEPALLAGSGSCVFGVFAAEPARDAAALLLAAQGLRVWRTRTAAAVTAPHPLPRRVAASVD